MATSCYTVNWNMIGIYHGYYNTLGFSDVSNRPTVAIVTGSLADCLARRRPGPAWPGGPAATGRAEVPAVTSSPGIVRTSTQKPERRSAALTIRKVGSTYMCKTCKSKSPRTILHLDLGAKLTYFFSAPLRRRGLASQYAEHAVFSII
jgi:hypothetical protein